ncbi:hypothetical protein NitYY0826_C0115 [Nitratiruptor sp. YY08-26]|uniref:hypothetical protein n=1 Tax=unclassified Nitratiruptor TaxID=2624044 RepID=UPI001915C80A|nr:MULTISPECIES: hypothetical protein [unclassified Nitratiruptor]BCD61281.1 hypothetical protein NitYY0813_C0115 [Nitratiruptor sp. YY08-13]BCD65214.1 hypothetical protein NitYY0826_C0115 [Nitratiruptor sp. YY08-26]
MKRRDFMKNAALAVGGRTLASAMAEVKRGFLSLSLKNMVGDSTMGHNYLANLKLFPGIGEGMYDYKNSLKFCHHVLSILPYIVEGPIEPFYKTTVLVNG